MMSFTTGGKTQRPSVLYKPAAAGPLDMRLSNIWKSAGRDLPKVTPDSAERGSDVAKLVCFGPSLEDTWKSVTEGEGDIWTISGANAYLTKRGITPHFHLEADPRAHKAKLLEGCNEETLYLIASRCADEVFDALEGKRTLLYHVYAEEEKEVLDMAFPGDFMVPPAWTMGITAWNVLLLLGYTKIKTWGMDGSFREDGRQHPSEHPNEEKAYARYTVDGGREFLSSPGHMIAAECVIQAIEKLPYGTIDFVGDGMIPHIFRQHQALV